MVITLASNECHASLNVSLTTVLHDFDRARVHMRAHKLQQTGMMKDQDVDGDGVISWDEFDGPKVNKPAAPRVFHEVMCT